MFNQDFIYIDANVYIYLLLLNGDIVRIVYLFKLRKKPNQSKTFAAVIFAIHAEYNGMLSSWSIRTSF
jgi:hypothetical protein